MRIQSETFVSLPSPATGSRCGISLRQIGAKVSRFLAAFYRLCCLGPTPTPLVAPRTYGLPPHHVLRLTKDSGIARIEVISGVVWLTETPARGDILLRPGLHFIPANRWPVVLEAIEPSTVQLHPH